MRINILFSSGMIVGIMTMLSRLLGFTRDILFARYFAASAAMDAFLVAFKIPNFFRRMFAEGAFNQAFVPVLSEYKTRGDQHQIKDLIGHIAGTMGGILLLITLIGVIGAPILIMLFAPGYLLSAADTQENISQYDRTVLLLRITFPYLFFISLVAFAGGILNSWKKFAIPAFTPVILNLVLISSIFLISPWLDDPVVGLAIGVFIAGALQLLLQLPFLSRLGLLIKPRWDLAHQGVKQIFQLMLPALFGASIAQINLLLDTIIATMLASGSISWLYYSDRLMEFPLGVLGVALATVILPDLSQHYARQSTQQFSQTLDQAIRWMVVLGLPAAVGLFMLAQPLIYTLFGSEHFSGLDVRMTAMSLMAYSFGLFGFVMVKVLLPGFYARKDTRTPVRIGIYALVVNMVFNLLIVLPWHFSGYHGAHSGLALATSLSALGNAYMLYHYLTSYDYYVPCPGWRKLWFQVGFALLGMVSVLVLMSNGVKPVLLGDGLQAWQIMDGWDRIVNLSELIIVAMLTYFTLLWLLGFRPVRPLRASYTS